MARINNVNSYLKHYRLDGGELLKDLPQPLPGLTFHGLRHSHKTLLIELGVPEVLQCERLGHAQPGVPGLYSHVAGPVRATMLRALQQRWEQPVTQAGVG